MPGIMPPTLSSEPSSSSVTQPFGSLLSLVESPVQEHGLPDHRLEDPESINIRGQLEWEKHMKDIGLKRRYKKVAVLMIHWEKQGTDSFDAQQEVDRLGDVLSKRYRFKVTERKLNPRQDAQLQMQMHLSTFILDEDDEQTLFIIYYAGHGTPDEITGRLVLANGNLSASDKVSQGLSRIVWQEAEGLIHRALRPDIFLIFDCCHAGRLLNMRQTPAWSERIFEFLGATGPNGTTPLPGKESFTSALIWALQELADEKAPFMSSELLQKILEAPDFYRDGQVPCMSTRGPRCARKLILEPMASETEGRRLSQEAGDDKASESFKYCLNLQLLLPDAPEDKDIKKMCDSFRDLILSDRFFARQVLWQGLYPKESARSQLPGVVREYAVRWQNKTLRKMIRTSSFGKHIREENDLGDVPSANSTPKDNAAKGAATHQSKRGYDELNATGSDTIGEDSPRPKRQRKSM